MSQSDRGVFLWEKIPLALRALPLFRGRNSQIKCDSSYKTKKAESYDPAFSYNK
jgi:hypothetical protein